MRMRHASLHLLCTLSLALFACSGSDTAATPPPAPNPPPAPAPNPSGAPGTVSAWNSSTYLVTFCDYPICHGAQGFTVYANGTYSIQEGTPPDGNLTAAEFYNFSNIANQIAAEAPMPSLACTQKGHLLGAPEYQLTLDLEGYGPSMISSQATNNQGVISCTTGNPNLAQILQQEMSDLAAKYDPGSTPSSGGTGSTGSVGSSNPS